MASVVAADGSSFYAIFDIDCKRYKATLSTQSLSWCKEKKAKYETCIPFTEVISVSSGTLDKSTGKLHTLLSSKWWHRKEETSCLTGGPTTLTVHYIERAWKHRWKLRSLHMHHSDPYVIIQWMSHIRGIIDSYVQRPKRLLVFINPFGGRRQANKIYEEKIRPLFQLANIEAHIIVTQRANHARDLLQEMSLTKLDGIICVGGDGMFSELLIGLLIRTQTENDIDFNNPKASLRRPQLRLGVIPGGSTDALAFCTTGTNDPVTSALHIIIGDSVGVDVSGIYSDNKLVRYATTGIGYGFLGDTLIDSEKYRWMGPARYDYSGVKTFLQNRTYEGELQFRLASQTASSPRDRQVCTYECKVCEKGACNADQKEEDNLDAFAWRRTSGKFIGINLATVSCACARTKRGLSPSAHLGDGTADIIIINQCSRVNFLRYLIATAFQRDPFRFPFINVHRIHEAQFRPLGAEDTTAWLGNSSSMQQLPRGNQHAPRNSVWNVDGEICENAALHIKVHCQLIQVFARGLEDFSSDVTCIPCSSDSGMNLP